MATRLDAALLRLDHTLLDRVELVVIPMQLGERARRVLLALLVATVALATLAPSAPPPIPSRVVEVPGRGWVDAGTVPGLPPSVADGARLEWRVQGQEAEPAPETTVAPPGALAAGARVSLNRASAAELEALPGIGPALAARIVAGRPYRAANDLDRVKGIGPKALERLEKLVEP